MSFSWPFQQAGSNAIPSTITYDLIINEQYPGLVLEPTIPGQPYSEIRVVNGCLWFVVNAMWNPNTAQWEQDSPANPANPAYAFAQCQGGTWARYIAPATVVSGTAIVWTAVQSWDSQGNVTIEPTTQTNNALIALLETLVWNVGAGSAAVARRVNVTDTSSAAASLLDDLQVGGVSKWSVRKDGTLVAGTVPASSITGVQHAYVASGVDATGTTPQVITFSPAYATSLLELEITPSFNYATHPWGVSYCTYNESKTGFTVQFYGAPAGSTIGFWWRANGN